jgi:KUP system potassium uptake protein
MMLLSVCSVNEAESRTTACSNVARVRPSNPAGRRLAALSVMALGVVYGDIGTSPLYAFRACFSAEYGLVPTEAAVYGVLSLIVWSLILIVGVKYIAFVMRLDNRGEGGIMALLALLRQRRRWGVLIGLGLFGTALLYGDGVITPAISVLSAAEGLEIAAPAFKPWVLPATLVILFLLFVFQKYGTARLGSVFGPIMLVWFGTIASLGLLEIGRRPAILLAVNPWYGLRLLLAHGLAGFLVLGAVVLAVTGAEALYADMGHFGRTPIRLAWFVVVLPALVLNYFGQGALVLRLPDAVRNPFYHLAPPSLLFPLVIIATLATIVASQALISGTFSLTQQCVQLHYSPRVSIVHTSRSTRGQIYVPVVNTALMIGCLLLVLAFESSGALGAAYGVAVTGTMAITTLLFSVIARQRWHWPRVSVIALAGAFLAIDLAFFGANVTKIARGGWVPLAIGGGLFVLMSTWHRGTELFRGLLSEAAVPMARFLDDVERNTPPRVRGTAVFLTPDIAGAPLVLQRHLKYNQVLHEEIILRSILTETVPDVEPERRVRTETLPQGFHRVTASYGFMERPDIQEIMAVCRDRGIRARPDETTYYLGSERILSTGAAPMTRWRKRLFGFMARNAGAPADFFNIPPAHVVELGVRIEL